MCDTSWIPSIVTVSPIWVVVGLFQPLTEATAFFEYPNSVPVNSAEPLTWTWLAEGTTPALPLTSASKSAVPTLYVFVNEIAALAEEATASTAVSVERMNFGKDMGFS